MYYQFHNVSKKKNFSRENVIVRFYYYICHTLNTLLIETPSDDCNNDEK